MKEKMIITMKTRLLALLLVLAVCLCGCGTAETPAKDTEIAVTEATETIPPTETIAETEPLTETIYVVERTNYYDDGFEEGVKRRNEYTYDAFGRVVAERLIGEEEIVSQQWDYAYSEGMIEITRWYFFPVLIDPPLNADVYTTHKCYTNEDGLVYRQETTTTLALNGEEAKGSQTSEYIYNEAGQCISYQADPVDDIHAPYIAEYDEYGELTRKLTTRPASSESTEESTKPVEEEIVWSNTYDESGRLICSEESKDGKVTWITEYVYEADRIIKCERNTETGNESTYTTYLDEQGNPIREEYANNGSIISTSEYIALEVPLGIRRDALDKILYYL